MYYKKIHILKLGLRLCVIQICTIGKIRLHSINERTREKSISANLDSLKSEIFE